MQISFFHLKKFRFASNEDANQFLTLEKKKKKNISSASNEDVNHFFY